jgi:hypothetical protein
MDMFLIEGRKFESSYAKDFGAVAPVSWKYRG